MNAFRKFSLLVPFSGFLMLIFLCILLYIYDAGMLFHKPYFRDMSFK